MGFDEAFFITSWAINNKFTKVLQDLGLIYLPLLIIWYRGYFQYIKDDNYNNIALLSEKQTRYSVIIFVVLYQFFFVPVLPINDIQQQKYFQHQDSVYNDAVVNKLGAIGNQAKLSSNIKIPLAWGGLDIGLDFLNHKLISVLPSATNIRQAMLDVKRKSIIKDRKLNYDYTDFLNQCYYPAKTKFDNFAQKSKTLIYNRFWVNKNYDDINSNEADWAGGSFYLHPTYGKGFYHQCQDTENCWDGNIKNANGLFYNYQVGTQTYGDWCGNIWQDNLKPNLLKEFDITLADSKFNITTLTKSEQIDKLLRERLIISKNKSNLGIASDDFKQRFNKGNPIENIIDLAQTADATAKIAWFNILIAQTINEIIVAFLPILQAILLALFVIFLPFVLVICAFDITVLVGFVVLYLGVYALQFVWATVRFVDDNILNIIYGSGNAGDTTVVGVASAALSNLSLTGGLLSIATGLMYFFATMFWLNMLSSATKGAVGAASDSMRFSGATDVKGDLGGGQRYWKSK